jgi:group I intron endonuclease
MEKICGIYKITSPTGKIYIGQSKDINKRIEPYKNARCKNQTKLYNSIIKYGWNSHVLNVIHTCCESKLNELEYYYIKEYDSFNTEHGLNLTSGGDFNGWYVIKIT